jgi:hypothetical protein
VVSVQIQLLSHPRANARENPVINKTVFRR